MIVKDKYGHPYTYVTPQEEQDILERVQMEASAEITKLIQDMATKATRTNTAVIKEEL